MNRLVLLVALFAPATAAAGGYVSLSIGPGADVGGELGGHYSGSGGSSGRLGIGHRTGPFAIQASLFGADLTGTSALTAGSDSSTVSLGVDARLYLPVAERLELYVRAGLDKTWVVSRGGQSELGYSGRGTELGIGAQYNFSPLPLLTTAAFLDVTRQSMTLTDDGRPPLEGDMTMLTVGLSVGF